MKKIFYILVSAIVALGAVACNNELDENIEANRSEGVSFTASLDETASRVLIGDLTDGKHPIAFENDDVIWASLEFDYSAPFVFTTTDGVNFTCTEANANGQLPEELIGKHVYFIVNGQKMVSGQTMNSAAGVDGIFFPTEVYDFQNNSTVTLGLAFDRGVFAFTSPYEVTLEASTTIFVIGADIRSSITIPQAEGTQYVPFMNLNGAEFTLSYSVNGEKVKEITRGYYNKIYTLGGLTEAVATVNGKNYTDIAKAVEAAGEAGVPVLVMDDCEATSAITLAEGKTVAIDLGGHTITFDENATEAIGFVNNGTMSITNGVIAGVASEANKDVITNNGTMTINGVTISQNYKTGAAIANYGNLTIDGNDTEVTTIGSTVRNDDTAPDAVLTINGGKFVQTGTYAANGTSKYNVDGRNGKVVINGGEFVSNNGVINAGCDVTINGGTFNSEITSAATRHLAYITGVLTINGGTFESIANSSAGGECFCLNRSTAKLVINDGYFASYWSGSMNPNAVISIYATGATYEVNAGYFSNNKVAGLSYAANTDSATSAKYPYIVKKPVVATVGGEQYADLAKAVVAAAEAGEEVVLSDDAVVTEPIAIPAGTEVTIDLNGNVITADDTTYAFNNLGTLTLKDSNAGAIPSSSSVMSKTGAEIAWSVSARGIYNGYDKDGNYVSTAKLIIESGNYQATGTNGGAAVYNYGILEVKGGYFKSNGGYGLNNQATGVMTIENAEINGGIYNSGGTLTVKEGTKLLQHLSGKHAIYNWKGSVTINGGEFDSLSGNELILADGENATVTINNGTFKKTAKSWLFGAATGKNISFVINDGKFYGYVNEPEMSVDTIRPYGDPIVVKGGMFNFDPTNWLAEGFQVVANGNGTYTVKEQTYKVYVMAQPKSSYASWTKVNIYTWYKEGGKDTSIEWPGEDSTSKTAVINGYTYNYYEYPATWNGKDVYVIANNGSAQTADIHLGTLDKDYYVVYSAAIGNVYTTAPAAGSIEEYKEPEVANMYYLKPNSNWTQANARFVGYFWNSTGSVWIELTDADKDGYYECDLKEFIPTKVIFLRKDPTGFVYNNWTCWNRVGDLAIAAGKNCYTMKAGDWSQENSSGYTGGTWSTK